MRNGRLGIGVVGAGSIGIRGALDHFVLEDTHDKTFLAAVCDPVPGRAEAAKEKYGVGAAYETYEDLLGDPEVDMIIVCSPIGLHYGQGLAAISAGKHIHFNKTMTVTSGEALHLIEEADKAGVKIVASPGQMLRPVNQEIKRLVQEGAIGDIAMAATGAGFGNYHETESVRTGDDILSNINPSWYWKKPGGGPMYDMTVYGLHSLTGVLGAAKRVTGMSGVRVKEREFRGEKYETDADDNTVAVLDFGNHTYAFVHGTAAGMVSEFGMPSYFGTKGSIVGGKLNGEPIVVSGDVHPLGPHVLGKHADMGESHVWEDSMQLVDWVLTGTPSIATAQHAAHVIEIIEKIYEASETGATQNLTTSF